MRRKATLVGLSALVLLLALANLQIAFAEDWWLWCWHKGSTLGVFVSGSNQAEANAALDDWDAHTDVTFNRVNVPTDISVVGADYGPTPWLGLATIQEYSFDWWHHWRWCRIQRARARYNSYWRGTDGTGDSNDIRGVFTQEIGHCLGLDHSNSGDVMGKGYYNNVNDTSSTSWNQINAKF